MEQGIKHKEGKNSLELDWTFIRHLGERMDANKGQYPRYNWKKPIEDPIELIDAIIRHAIAIQEGELEDDGREFGHIEAIACDAMMFFAQMMLKKKKKFEQELIKQFEMAQPLVLSNDPTGKEIIEISGNTFVKVIGTVQHHKGTMNLLVNSDKIITPGDLFHTGRNEDVLYHCRHIKNKTTDRWDMEIITAECKDEIDIRPGDNLFKVNRFKREE